LFAGAVCLSRSSCSTVFGCGSFGLCLGIFLSVQESHLLRQVIMLHLVLLWKFWHLSFCSGFSCLGTCLEDEVGCWVITILQHGGHFVHYNVTVLLVMHSASLCSCL
jgi:hypothetical protein